MSVVSSREFNRDVSAVKRAAARGPVVITDHGEPSHVLLTYEEYRRLAHAGPTLGEAFVVDDEIPFDPSRPGGPAREVQW